MANKMTNVIALATAIEALSSVEGFDAEALAKLSNIKATYEKKSSSSTLKKPTATQIANEALKVRILDTMEVGVQYTVTDLVKLLDSEFTNQKLSALLNRMDGVSKVVDKRKTFFVKNA